MNHPYSKYMNRIIKENTKNDFPWWLRLSVFDENSSMVFDKNAAYVQNMKMDAVSRDNLNQQMNQNIQNAQQVSPEQNPKEIPPEDGDPNQMQGEVPPEEVDEEKQQLSGGKTYHLKKLYNKFNSLKNSLDSINSDNMYRLKSQVDEAKDMFEFIVQGFDQYADRIDDVIESFEKFIYLASKEAQKLMNLSNRENDKYEQTR